MKTSRFEPIIQHARVTPGGIADGTHAHLPADLLIVDGFDVAPEVPGPGMTPSKRALKTINKA